MENLQTTTYPKNYKRPYTNAEYIIYKKNTLDEKTKNPVYFLGMRHKKQEPYFNFYLLVLIPKTL